MSEKVVLPRFDLPRDTTRIAVRAAWAAGALMVVATLILGVALWHRRSAQLEAAEQIAAKAEAARLAALAPPPAPPAPKVVAAAAATGGTTLGKSETTMAAVVPSAATEAAPHRSSSHARHGKATHGKASARFAADAKHAGKPGKPAGKAKVDDDFIDKLLSK